MEKKIKLLFVDDEEKFLRSTTTRLAMRGLDVHAFTNGLEALAASEKTNFDVALLDLKMPGMDGEELLKKLKARQPELEVIILTGHGSIGSAVECTRAGAFVYLQKPCELDQVISAISEAYAASIKSKKTSKAARVEELLGQAMAYSPIALLEELRKLDQEE